MTNNPHDPSACVKCMEPCPCCEEGSEDKAPHLFVEHFPDGCPHKDSSALLEKVKELSEEEKSLPSHENGYAYDSGGLYDKSLTEDVIGISNGELYMEKAEVEFIVNIRNAFPSIASLCLEQAEEIKRLRGALEEMMAVARFYMRKRNGYEPDEFCDSDITSHGSKYEQAHHALSFPLLP